MPRSNSTGYLNNKKLKGEGVNISLTLKQIEEYQKCYTDPIYFIRNYVKIVNVDKGEIFFDLWPFQEKMIQNFVKHRFNVVKCPRQVGKCLVGDACIYIRGRKTGEEKNVTIKEFYELNKPSVLRSMWNFISNWFRFESQVLQ